MGRIMFHADDFAADKGSSALILECVGYRSHPGFSVLANSPALHECMSMFFESGKKARVRLHFNLAEGPALSRSARTGILTDERGMFTLSFLRVLMLSFSAERYVLRQQIKEELRAQLRAYLGELSSGGVSWSRARRLSVDSHQHYHMIPMVLEVMMEVIKEEECVISYIRIPAEPLSPFLKHPELYHTYRPVNIVKNLVLNTLNLVNARRLASYRKRSALFFGIMLSGRMDAGRVRTLLPDFARAAKKKGVSLEVLAHPGYVDPERGKLPDPGNKLCAHFYTSENRLVEGRMLKEICR